MQKSKNFPIKNLATFFNQEKNGCVKLVVWSIFQLVLTEELWWWMVDGGGLVTGRFFEGRKKHPFRKYIEN